MSSVQRIGYFSDVHSNLLACLAMARVIKDRQVGWSWYFGGDAVGWLYQPIEVVKIIMSLMKDDLIKGAVAGNHDLLARDVFADLPDQVARKIATAFSAGALSQNPSASEFLRRLPLVIDLGEENNCVIVHHSPFMLPAEGTDPTINHFQYLSKDFEVQLASWANYRRRVILSGHDHVPAVHWMLKGLSDPTLRDVTTIHPNNEETLEVPIDPTYQYWVQSGAAGGPPRDGVNKLNWVEYIPGEVIRLHRLAYETTELRRVIDRQPYGSLLNWTRFSAPSDKKRAGGSAV